MVADFFGLPGPALLGLGMWLGLAVVRFKAEIVGGEFRTGEHALLKI